MRLLNAFNDAKLTKLSSFVESRLLQVSSFKAFFTSSPWPGSQQSSRKLPEIKFYHRASSKHRSREIILGKLATIIKFVDETFSVLVVGRWRRKISCSTSFFVFSTKFSLPPFLRGFHGKIQVALTIFTSTQDCSWSRRSKSKNDCELCCQERWKTVEPREIKCPSDFEHNENSRAAIRRNDVRRFRRLSSGVNYIHHLIIQSSPLPPRALLCAVFTINIFITPHRRVFSPRQMPATAWREGGRSAKQLRGDLRGLAIAFTVILRPKLL